MSSGVDVDLLMARYEKEPAHPLHVSMLAMQLFSDLESHHQFGVKERRYLEIAAKLHDIGWSQTKDGKGHHKWSARLMRKHRWRTLQKNEVTIVSLIARYHRKALPQMKHEPYAKLIAVDRKTVSWMAAILRVADALDRRHLQLVTRVRLISSEPGLCFQVEAPTQPTPEFEMAMEKGDLLQEVVGKKLEFQWKPVVIRKRRKTSGN